MEESKSQKIQVVPGMPNRIELRSEAIGCLDWGKDLKSLECEQPEGYVLKDLELRLVDKKGYPTIISNDGELFNVKVELVGIYRWVTTSART